MAATTDLGDELHIRWFFVPGFAWIRLDSSFLDGHCRATVPWRARMDDGLLVGGTYFDRHERGVKDDAKSD